MRFPSSTHLLRIERGNGGRSASQLGKMLPLWVGCWSESDSLERARHCFLDNPLCEKQMNAVTPTIKRVLCLWKWCAFDAGDYELRCACVSYAPRAVGHI